MPKEASISDWERLSKSSGITGVIAFLLVFFASMRGGEFDWVVFFFGFTALFLCWARTWVLVPIHLRYKDAEEKEWQRYLAGDWRYVDSLSGLTGVEIDELRDVFRRGDDRAARQFIDSHWVYSEEHVQGFLRFFNETFNDIATAYIDENGRLRSFD